MPEISTIPPALDALLREITDDPRIYWRLALAPRPELGFRSPYEDRALWEEPTSGATRERRRAWERAIGPSSATLGDLSRPYFVSEGTGGTLQSPYEELSDAEYWLYVDLWGGEAPARAWLERPLQALDGQSTLAFLRKARVPPGALRRLLGGRSKREDHRAVAWQAAWSAWVDGLVGQTG